MFIRAPYGSAMALFFLMFLIYSFAGRAPD